VNFGGATFSDGASFDGATFGDRATFAGATFGDLASFGHGLSFELATFADGAYFAGAGSSAARRSVAQPPVTASRFPKGAALRLEECSPGAPRLMPDTSASVLPVASAKARLSHQYARGNARAS